ncbi:glycosyl hydrolase family 28-related protein [Paenibacillus glycinis]|uniref:Pectate lyase superfamily protein domain-containing protein n=1 Tax=Paenibacillus glycinis TaxID=2697035 RepID=A0ABW9XNK0_9BACL|nr:glycosyl hydrolase family 28-related protein [Paenibacillus glycinis]NBD24214.1 hypothetical protein [Paenibacillus glycinis]
MKSSIKKMTVLFAAIALVSFGFANIFSAKAFASSKTINVKEMGAKGDGRTDDTAAIQKALDQGSRTSATVYFPSGTYSVNPSKTLSVNGNTKVQGAGSGTVIKASSGSFGWELVRVYGQNVDISSISLDGNKQVNRVLVVNGGSSSIRVSGVNVMNASESKDPSSDYYSAVVAGILVYGNTSKVTIDNVDVHDIYSINKVDGSLVARGIYVTTTWNAKETAAKNLTITNSHIHHIGPADDGDGIYYEDPNLDNNMGQDTNSVISNNTFDNCAKRAIKIYAQGVKVTNNHITNSYNKSNYYQGTNKGQLAPDMFSAISVYGDNNTISNNQIDGIGSYYAAIEVSASQTLKNITIINNTIIMGQSSNIGGTTAIRLGNISNFNISSNKIINGERGIWTWQNAEQGVINGNNISMVQGGGIDLSTYLAGAVQRNITCKNNAITAKNFSVLTARSNVNVVLL